MATITTADVRKIWKFAYRKGHGKEELQASPLPAPGTIRAIVQAIEDFWVSRKVTTARPTTLQSVMNTAAGITLAPATAGVYEAMWLLLRSGRL